MDVEMRRRSGSVRLCSIQRSCKRYAGALLPGKAQDPDLESLRETDAFTQMVGK
jgi:hypothetical protein